MPASVIMGQKRVAPATTQPPAKRARPDMRAGSFEDTVSSAGMSAAASILQELVEEDLWDDRMGYEALVNSPSVSQEPAERGNVPQEVPEVAPRTGVSSRVVMSVQDRLLQDCWLNWEDVRRAHRDREMARGILVLVSWSGAGTGHVHGRRLSEEEEARFTTWKQLYIEQPAGFEEERLATGDFSLDDE